MQRGESVNEEATSSTGQVMSMVERALTQFFDWLALNIQLVTTTVTTGHWLQSERTEHS